MTKTLRIIIGALLIVAGVFAAQPASASSVDCRIGPNHAGTFATWALARFDISTGGAVRPTILQVATLPNSGPQINHPIGWELRATKTNGTDFKLWSGTVTLPADGAYRTVAVPASTYYLNAADGWDLSTVRWRVLEAENGTSWVYVTRNSTNAIPNPGCPPNPWA